MAGLSAALSLLAAVPPAALASGGRRIGSRPPLPAGAQAAGALSQTTSLHVTVTLQPRDPAALAAYAQEVATPGSPVYHRYLSVAEFAQRFGPTPAQITAARANLRAQGLAPGPMAANDLSFPVIASAGKVSGAFNTSFERYRLPGGRTAYANTSAPQVSGGGASVIQGVLGLNNLAVEKPQGQVLRGRKMLLTARALPRTTMGTSAVTPCASALNSGGFAANQIATAYGFDGLYGAGDLGAGVTVAVYELEPYSSSDIAAYASCYGLNKNSVTATYVGTGQSCNGDPECGLEDVLDIEDVMGLVPGGKVQVYVGANTNAGAYQTYARIVSDDTARVISTSWGECEAQVGASVAAAENTLFEEAASQGQSVFAAAGDSGTADCTNAVTGEPIAARAVDDPASQPYVTGVGGTSLNSLVSPLGETVWNNGTGNGAGGGGVSTLWGRPGYQFGFAEGQSSVTCSSSGFACRQVPDVAADANPNTGYAIYWNGTWGPVGGTSAAAPTWASLTALADASSACSSPVGFANPVLYAAARTDYAANFNDVTADNNSYDGVAGYAAGPGYDMASGLGSPRGTALAASLCGVVGDSVSLTVSPGSQVSTAGRTISPVTISGQSSRGATPMTYSGSGLPAGLVIDRSTGRVTGKPTRPGIYGVTLGAVDHNGMIATDSFTWTVRAPVVTLKAVSRKSLRLGRSARIALRATDSVGAVLTFTSSHLPPGLRINRRTGVISGRPSRGVKRKVTVRAADAFGGSARRQFMIVVRAGH